MIADKFFFKLLLTSNVIVSLEDFLTADVIILKPSHWLVPVRAKRPKKSAFKSGQPRGVPPRNASGFSSFQVAYESLRPHAGDNYHCQCKEMDYR